MENLIFCLNATIPVFITMIFGYFFKRIHLFDAAFLSKMNKFVFVAALPVLLFEDISTTDLRKAWDTSFVIFNTAVHTLFDCCILSIKGSKYSGRICTGKLSQQCRNSGHRLYSKYLWKFRNGSAYDCCDCSFI
jgi:hypothetical protein